VTDATVTCDCDCDQDKDKDKDFEKALNLRVLFILLIHQKADTVK
jgi:hypothetical protein